MRNTITELQDILASPHVLFGMLGLHWEVVMEKCYGVNIVLFGIRVGCFWVRIAQESYYLLTNYILMFVMVATGAS